jgi:type II secretory pathway predicted ATPase ExeA
MLLQYFGFARDPFGATPDPSYLFNSSTHREALASLKYGFYANRGFTVLIAPPGMGKTTLLFGFLGDIRGSARSVLLFDIDRQCEPRELVGYILRDIGIVPAANSADVHEQLNEVLLAEGRAGRRFVVVIDEAQNLSEAALEKVRLLTNFETPQSKLMQIVLAGQPQLSEKLMRPSLVQLRQRVSTICHLEPLSLEETRAYISHRLRVAGYNREPLFTESALSLIVETSGGIPRTINNLCFNALSLCCALKGTQVNLSMASEIIADQQLTPPPRHTPRAIVMPPAPAMLPTQLISTSQTQPSSQLTPQRESISPGRGILAAPSVITAESEDILVSKRRRLRVLAVAITLASGLIAVLGFSGLRISQLRTATDLHPREPTTPAMQIPPNTASLPVAAFVPDTAPFEITVEPNQTLEEIVREYMGSFDHKHLEQVEALNPKLADPNHIEPGQKIWLPGPSIALSANRATTPAKVRNTQ